MVLTHRMSCGSRGLDPKHTKRTIGKYCVTRPLARTSGERHQSIGTHVVSYAGDWLVGVLLGMGKNRDVNKIPAV